jgi:hypothetical protein
MLVAAPTRGSTLGVKTIALKIAVTRASVTPAASAVRGRRRSVEVASSTWVRGRSLEIGTLVSTGRRAAVALEARKIALRTERTSGGGNRAAAEAARRAWKIAVVAGKNIGGSSTVMRRGTLEPIDAVVALKNSLVDTTRVFNTGTAVSMDVAPAASATGGRRRSWGTAASASSTASTMEGRRSKRVGSTVVEATRSKRRASSKAAAGAGKNTGAAAAAEEGAEEGRIEVTGCYHDELEEF